MAGVRIPVGQRGPAEEITGRSLAMSRPWRLGTNVAAAVVVVAAAIGVAVLGSAVRHEVPEAGLVPESRIEVISVDNNGRLGGKGSGFVLDRRRCASGSAPTMLGTGPLSLLWTNAAPPVVTHS
jgi:hypothetical protein